jgi:hypothetical protein
VTGVAPEILRNRPHGCSDGLDLLERLLEILGMAVEADMAWVVDPAASFGEQRRDVAPVGLGGKDDDVVQPATVPAILDAGRFIP